MNRIIICKQNKKRAMGMTLIEILIVVVIVSVLAGIVYPSYTNYVLKAHRTQAMTDMVKIQLKLEQDYSSGSTYNTSLDTTTLCESDASRYRFKITADDTYTIKATPIGAQETDDCSEMTLNAKGDGTPARCW